MAGSDLIFALSELAARRGYRVFFAGGAPGVAEAAAQRLIARYPGLQVVGTAAPSFGGLADDEYLKLRAQIIEARPHLLILAASMPHGERWLSAHLEELEVPVGVNLGASIDFAAGRIDRAPRWMQKSGLEWAFRLMLEPGRLFSRYARNARFILGMTLRGPGRSPGQPAGPAIGTARRQARLSKATPMIISQTPYRVSFAGGGTDLPAFYRQGVRGRPEHDD